MSSSTKALDPAFQGVGQRVGTEIWRIENFQPVPLPKSDYGKFYSGDSYIVLQTSQGRGGAYVYDIHFWIGKDTSQDESGTAAIKTVELDASLGGRAVQHREIQGHESDKFLSYFKPCIIPLEGGIASGFTKPEEEEFETRLYICKGKRVVRMKQVPFARSSLNHDDVFILDTQNKIYQFNGANSNIQERAKALEVIQFLKEKYHGGTSDVAIVGEYIFLMMGSWIQSRIQAEFWVLFGGFAPIGKKVVSEDDIIPEATPAKLYSITDEVKIVEGELSKSSLENNKCYLLDCGAEIFVWVGRVTQLEERKAAIQTAEEFVASQNRPKATRITRLIQGYETHAFKSNFESWPSGSVAPGAEEGRGKVAALLKQQGVGVKGMTKSAPVSEEVPPLLEGGGKMEGGLSSGYKKNVAEKGLTDETYTADSIALIRISGTSIHKNKVVQVDAVAASLNSAECFLLQSGSSFFTWHGNQCTFEQQQLASKVAEFMKPGVTLKHAKEGTESSAFWFALGGKQSYTSKKVSTETVRDPHLFTFSFNKGKFQVEEVYNFSQDDLLTEDILILDTHAEVFIWVGQCVDSKEKQSVFEIGEKYIEMAASLEGLSPNVPLYKVTEGNEPCFFTTYFSWDLAKASIQGNSFQKKVSIFFGFGSTVEEKSNGNQGGPTQRASALAALSSAFSPSSGKSPPGQDKSNGSGQGPRQRAEALAALSSAFGSSSGNKSSAPRPAGPSQGSQRAAAVAALSQVLTAEKKKKSPDDSPTQSPPSETSAPAEAKSETTYSETEGSQDGGEVKEAEEVAAVSENSSESPKKETVQFENDGESNLSTFSYDQLKAKSENPVTGIDFKRREANLS
uniref:Gelsolin-like domain-containing protein n=1 Tax=Cannabis sativa TaxID=3483 RepID=A0A803P6W3_CANSA